MSSWTHKDPPEKHPMWETQVNLERGMMRDGANKVRDRVIKAEQRGQLTRLSPVRNLVDDWLPGVADGIKAWLRAVEGSKGGPKPLAYSYVKGIDPFVSGLIALRAILDGIHLDNRSLVVVAKAIGLTVEHEQKIRLWEAEEPKLFWAIQDEQQTNRATATHRRRVNINRFNHLNETKQIDIAWTPWSGETHFRVGVTLIDVVIRKTGWFETQQDPEHVFKKGQFSNRPQIMLAPKAGMKEWLGETVDRMEMTSPDYKPTVMPPKRWTGTRDGGYWTPYVKVPRLVRFKAHQESQKEHAADEYDALDMPATYEAIHLLQETEWRVNKKVLEVALWAARQTPPVGKLPQLSDEDLPTKTPRMIERREYERAYKELHGAKVMVPAMDQQTKDEIARWKRAASPVYRRNAKRASRAGSLKTTLLIAQEFADYDTIYFPHMLDFRGRMYPIANYLQPQGGDLARGLLLFGEGLPITLDNGGAGWLAIQLASCWGKDTASGVDVEKLSFEERIDWVEEHEDLWRRIAADPYGNREWGDSDKPFQVLAACLEWVAFLDHGFGYLSHLPVMVDGTCNGIQHLSALTRDKVAGAYVNLVPSDRPQDIYKHVARELQDTVERISKAGGLEGAKADYWLALTEGNFPRGMTKRQVMVLPYGGSKDAYFKYTRVWLDEVDPPRVEFNREEDQKAYNEERNGRIVFLVTHMWDTVNSVVSGAMKVMKWLQDCARAATLEEQPLWWTTPTGFTVRHFYGLSKDKQCDIMLDGERHQIVLTERTAKLSVKEQLQGISPNFIHSLDASCLTECLSKCRAAGIWSFASVHDAYGTHAANMWPLSRLLREAFVAIHERDLLGEFKAACVRNLVSALAVKHNMDPLAAAERAEEIIWKATGGDLELGDLGLNDVLLSDYFFA